jgi:hypothetical protein
MGRTGEGRRGEGEGREEEERRTMGISELRKFIFP